jgi:tetratricopeptide (TPR) repeat protein
MEDEQYERAVGAFRRVIAIEAPKVTNSINLGTALFFNGKFKEAIDAYESGFDKCFPTEFDKFSPFCKRLLSYINEAYADYGAMLEAVGLYHEAADAYKRAVKRSDSKERFWKLSGIVHLSLGDVDCAIHDLKKAFKSTPSDYDAAGWLARSYLTGGHPKKAVRVRALRHKRNGVLVDALVDVQNRS